MRPEILTKASCVLFLVTLSFIADWTVNLALFILLSFTGLLLNLLSREFIPNRSAYLRFLAYALTATLLITVLNGIFLQEGDTLGAVSGLHFYRGGLVFGVTTAARLAVISITLFLFFATTPLRMLIDFFQQVSLPGPLIVILFLALHFIAQIPDRIDQIYTAQEARGAPVRGHLIARARALFSILFPLILSSISETLERGSALELRGFRGELVSSSLAPLSTSSKLIASVIFLITCMLIVFALLK